MYQPFPKQQILDSPKEFSDDNFEFNLIDVKYRNRVENTVGEGEIARYEQFSSFPSALKTLVL